MPQRHLGCFGRVRSVERQGGREGQRAKRGRVEGEDTFVR